jgi:hypothetical protein
VTDGPGTSPFRDAHAARAGGWVLVVAGPLVALPLLLHPLPSGGFEEQATMLSETPLWGAIHAAIAVGFVLTALGALLVLAGGGPRRSWVERLAWGAMVVGMVFFTGVALINAWVMHPLAARAVGDPVAAALFDAFNDLLVGYGWLGNPLFLAGLTAVAVLEVRDSRLGLPWWAALGGLIVVGLSWLRGIGSATGVTILEPFVLANVPAFLWLSLVGWRIAALAGRGAEPAA